MGTRFVTLQLTRPEGFKPVSWLIRIIQKTSYSHVRFQWLGTGGAIPIIYEASGSYLHFIGPIAAKQKPVKIIRSYPLELAGEQYKKWVQFCVTNAGVQYGLVQMLGMAWADAMGLKQNPLADGRKTQVCSEVAYYFFKDVMEWSVGELDPDRTGPKQINKYLEDHVGSLSET